jgi:hypothetical protein
MSRKLGGDNNVVIQFTFKDDGATVDGLLARRQGARRAR